MFKETIPCCYFPTKVIIIDDNADFSDHLSLAFGKDFQSDCFASPIEALKHLEKYNDIVKTLFSKHISASSEQNGFTKLSIDVEIASIYKEIYNHDLRFDRPTVLIVDYSMPKMNGLEFCEQLIGLPYKKIVLTGEADNDFAVEAFNQGKIERFVKKGETNCVDILKHYIRELNIEYFNQMSQSVFDMLNKDGQSLLHSQTFIELFNQIISKYNIVEFYLIDETGSYLLLDQEGNRIELIVRTDEDMQCFKELAEDDDAITNMIAKNEKMPRLLTWKDRLIPVKDWELNDVSLLHDGDSTYYYSIVKRAALSNKTTQQEAVSYQDYLYAS